MQSQKRLEPRIYKIPDSNHRVVLSEEVLDFFAHSKQNGTQPEAGGLLFAEFNLPIIRIVEATPPKSSDKRWRTLFIPNRIRQRWLIKQRFKKGLHFVGEWHTHPQRKPTPSSLDLESMKDSFIKSRHELNYFIMVIVGNFSSRLELWFSIHDGNKYSNIEHEEC